MSEVQSARASLTVNMAELSAWVRMLRAGTPVQAFGKTWYVVSVQSAEDVGWYAVELKQGVSQ